MLFLDRTDAGEQLGDRLAHLAGEPGLVVLGIPRGGLVVGGVVAARLRAPLLALPAARIRAQHDDEVTIGAVAPDGTGEIDRLAVRLLDLPAESVEQSGAAAHADWQSRVARFGTAPDVRGSTVILVDDGVASGWTLRTAASWAARAGARRIVVAAPVGQHHALAALQASGNEVVAVAAPIDLLRVGLWYDAFEPVEEHELQAAMDRVTAGQGTTGPRLRIVTVAIPAGVGASIMGELVVPAAAHGIVLFAHGSGSSRHSYRNWRVARALIDGGFAVLLVDLLTAAEQAADRRAPDHRFDIPLLTGRVVAALDWLAGGHAGRFEAIGAAGSSTGAAAVFAAARFRPGIIHAAVARAGRLDLIGAGPPLSIPSLLTVGSADPETVAINQEALRMLGGEVQLRIVEGADHDFAAPAHLDEAAQVAVAWFQRHLRGLRHEAGRSGATLEPS